LYFDQSNQNHTPPHIDTTIESSEISFETSFDQVRFNHSQVKANHQARDIQYQSKFPDNILLFIQTQTCFSLLIQILIQSMIQLVNLLISILTHKAFI